MSSWPTRVFIADSGTLARASHVMPVSLHERKSIGRSVIVSAVEQRRVI
jgi:hypothetical protein